MRSPPPPPGGRAPPRRRPISRPQGPDLREACLLAAQGICGGARAPPHPAPGACGPRPPAFDALPGPNPVASEANRLGRSPSGRSLCAPLLAAPCPHGLVLGAAYTYARYLRPEDEAQSVGPTHRFLGMPRPPRRGSNPGTGTRKGCPMRIKLRMVKGRESPPACVMPAKAGIHPLPEGYRPPLSRG